ncbi:MAG: response regulator [Microbacteriaceae bacterium]
MTVNLEKASWRILVVEDDELIAALVSDGMRSFGHHVDVATSPTSARELVEESDPHLLFCDLNFPNGESGVELICRLRVARPWLAIVVLSNHQSPELAVADAHALPTDVVYLVKSRIRSLSQLLDGAVAAMTGVTGVPAREFSPDDSTPIVSTAHAEVLRLLAEGSSTKTLAETRGTTVRAVESLLVRLYVALDIDVVSEPNPRLAAIRKWQSGRVRVARVKAEG